MRQRAAALLLLTAFAWLPLGGAAALDRLRVEKTGDSVAFSVLDIGEEAGLWRAQDIAIESISAAGVRAQQLLASGDADIDLGAGTSMGFRLRGVPAIAVAALTGEPATFALDVRPGGSIRSVEDLKGKPIGVTTAGALTDWLVKEFSRQRGWGPGGIPTIALGTAQAELAALKTGQVEGFVTTLVTSYEIAARGDTQILMSFAGIVRDFHANVIMATDKLVGANPALLQRFLAGWFRSVAYAKTHKQEAVRICARILGVSEASVARAYDGEMAALSDDGRLNPQAVATIARSLAETGLAEAPPDPKLLYTDRFVPVKF